MFTIIATIKYRDHVPYGWIANEFCELEIMGVKDSIVQAVNKEWDKVRFEKYDKVKEQIAALEAQKVLLNTEAADLDAKYKSSKKWYRFANATEKAWKNSAEMKRSEIYQIDSQIQDLDNDKFFTASELKRKARDLLVRHGFVLINTSSAGDECVTHTEVWHKTSD